MNKNKDMKMHFRKGVKWMLSNTNFHSPFKPIEGYIIFGGMKKKEMPKNIDVLIEGFDIAPKGTIDMLLDIIEKECPLYIKKETVPSIKIDGEQEGYGFRESRQIISDCIVVHNPDNGFH